MNLLMAKIENTYHFSEYELKVIRYVITALFYDLSKLVILCTFFAFFHRIPHFLCALLPFFLLRIKNGGIHTSSYLSCLLLTFLVFIPTVMILPDAIPICSILRLALMIPCAITEYLLGPQLSHRDIHLNKEGIQKSRLASFQVVLLVAVVMFLFPNCSYLLAGFWMVILHTIQLAVTKLYKEVKMK